MARVLHFVPFSTCFELSPTASPVRPSPELKQRAEAVKDEVYRRHVSRVLDPTYAQDWPSLSREQKLCLVAQVAERRARAEISSLASGVEREAELEAEYVRRAGLTEAQAWTGLSEEQRNKTFFAAAVRRFLRQVTEEVLRELRAEAWSRASTRSPRA
jgi:hypothetical protein